MTIKFDETIRAILFMPGKGQDWMAGVNVEGGETHCTYRFRYYGDKPGEFDAFERNDRKSWSGFTTQAPATEVVVHLKDVANTMAKMGYMPTGEDLSVLERGEHEALETFMKRFQAQPWVFSRSATEEEVAKEEASNNTPGFLKG